VLGQRVFGWARRTPYLADLPRDVAVLSFVAFAVALGYGIAAPALPVYARTFGVSAFVASTVISGFALMRLLSAGPAGLMVDRFGERRVMSIGIWVVAGSSLLTALAQDFPQLLVLRGVGGIGSSMFTVSAMALLLRTAGPEQRGRASGAFQAGFLFGGVTGPAIGGAVTSISIRAPFVVYGITLVVAGTLAATYLSREPSPASVAVDAPAGSGSVSPGAPAGSGSVSPGAPAGSGSVVDAPAGSGSVVPGAPATGDEAATGSPPSKAPPASLSAALRSAAYRASLMVNLSSGFIVFGLRISLVPLFVTEGLDQGVGLVGIGFLCAAATQAVMLIPAGRWTDTSGRRGSMLVGAATLTVSMLLLALGSGAVGFLLAMAASGLASAFLAPASSAVVGDLTRGLSGGRVVSAYQMVGDLGGILGPLIAGALADAAGFQWAFAAGVVIGLVTLAFIVVMPETLRRTPEESTAGTP
jgi:MFS family permease